MEQIDLIKILHGDVSRIDKVIIDDSALYDVKITVSPENVAKMLLAYLNKSINDEQLKNWANFLCSRAEYVSIDADFNIVSDYYEDMWYVIQRLSTPEIDGEINDSTVKKYLNELEKYKDL